MSNNEQSEFKRHLRNCAQGAIKILGAMPKNSAGYVFSVLIDNILANPGSDQEKALYTQKALQLLGFLSKQVSPKTGSQNWPGTCLFFEIIRDMNNDIDISGFEENEFVTLQCDPNPSKADIDEFFIGVMNAFHIYICVLPGTDYCVPINPSPTFPEYCEQNLPQVYEFFTSVLASEGQKEAFAQISESYVMTFETLLVYSDMMKRMVMRQKDGISKLKIMTAHFATSVLILKALRYGTLLAESIEEVENFVTEKLASEMQKLLLLEEEEESASRPQTSKKKKKKSKAKKQTRDDIFSPEEKKMSEPPPRMSSNSKVIQDSYPSSFQPLVLSTYEGGRGTNKISNFENKYRFCHSSGKQIKGGASAQECDAIYKKYKSATSKSREIAGRLEFSEKCIDKNCWDVDHCGYMDSYFRSLPKNIQTRVQKYCDVAEENVKKLGPFLTSGYGGRALTDSQKERIRDGLYGIEKNVMIIVLGDLDGSYEHQELSIFLEYYQQYIDRLLTRIDEFERAEKEQVRRISKIIKEGFEKYGRFSMK